MNFSACWIAAARWSSRLDFRPLVSALDQGPAALARAGAPAAFLRDVGKTSPLEGPSALRIDQPDYPKALLALRRPPPLLWWRGERRVLERPALAIVGARSCTPWHILIWALPCNMGRQLHAIMQIVNAQAWCHR